MKTKNSLPLTYSQLSWQGFSSGVFLTYGYALIFLLYGAIRLIITLIAVVEPPHLVKTLFLLFMSLLLTILVFAALMSLIAGFSGALTAILSLWLTRWMSYKRALIGVTLTLALVMNALIFALSGMNMLTMHLMTYLFWIGLPSLIYIGYSIVAGNLIEQNLASTPQSLALDRL